MENKIVTLIIRITRLSKTFKSVSEDLNKIGELLQDPHILAVINEKGLGVLTAEDYD